jgi:hypothetical protein
MNSALSDLHILPKLSDTLEDIFPQQWGHSARVSGQNSVQQCSQADIGREEFSLLINRFATQGGNPTDLNK